MTYSSDLKKWYLRTLDGIAPFIFSVCQEAGLAVTVTRGFVGVWDMQAGHLMSQLADSPLGAIVTNALITPSGK